MKNDKFMTTLKLGSKGQIVIPKEARDMFGIKPGDTVLLLADAERGIAITNYEAYKQFAEAILRADGSACVPPKNIYNSEENASEKDKNPVNHAKTHLNQKDGKENG